MRRSFKNQKQAALVLGYRSGLEEKIGKQLDDLQVEYTYETEKISYIQPAKKEHINRILLKLKRTVRNFILKLKED